MTKVALRGLMDHKGRLISTLLAVALGVAFVAGVLMLTDTMNKSFDDLFATAFEGTDAVVRSDQTIDDGFGGEIRSRLDASVLDDVRGAPDVAEAEGFVQGFARIIDKDGDPVGDPAMGPPTFGGNWSEVDQLNGFTLAEGRAPRVRRRGGHRPRQRQGHRLPGGRPRCRSRPGPPPRTSSWSASPASATPTAPAAPPMRCGPLRRPSGWWASPASSISIGVVADQGVSQTEVARSVEDQLAADGDSGLEVLTGEEITEESQSDLKDQLSFITIFLLVFAVIAVVVGTFVIYNSFAIIVAQRGREMALMRAVGASRRQVRRSVFVEALAIGILGSVIGFLLGLGVASVLVSLFDLPGSLVVRPSAAVIALVVGVVVTLVSALVPAWRASRVPPVAAMRDLAIETAVSPGSGSSSDWWPRSAASFWW